MADKSFMKKFLLLGLSLVLIFFYQQCSQITMTPVMESGSTSDLTAAKEVDEGTEGGGNGDGYTGKLYVADGDCPTKPLKVSSEIYYDEEIRRAWIVRERCEAVDPVREVPVSDFVFLSDSVRFEYKGEVFRPYELEARIRTETFNLFDSRACASSGYCMCGTRNQLNSCGASDHVPDYFCESKGYKKALSWTCNPGPMGARLCDFRGDCFTNQNTGNWVCNEVICTD